MKRVIFFICITLIFLLAIKLSVRILHEYIWVWIYAFIFFYTITISLIFKKKYLKFGALHFSFVMTTFVFMAFSIYEGYLVYNSLHGSSTSGLKRGGGYTSNYFKPDTLLGYGPDKDGIYTSIECEKNDTIYNVSYTIKNHHRLTPNSNDSSKNCILFFGCSFAFGEGLNDNETLPYYYNEIDSNRNAILNYAFHGYGPHQMLANIEYRVSDDIKNYSGKKIAIYSALYAHIKRSAGKADWDKRGPNYQMVDGELKYTGSFDYSKYYYTRVIKEVQSRSLLYKMLINNIQITNDDKEQYLEILKKTNKIFKEKNIPFYILINDNVDKNDDFNFLTTELKKYAINYIFVSDAISSNDIKKYAISKYDNHPNGLCNKVVAELLYKRIHSH